MSGNYNQNFNYIFDQQQKGKAAGTQTLINASTLCDDIIDWDPSSNRIIDVM